jgi:DNA mismatch repair ATPase MutS
MKLGGSIERDDIMTFIESLDYVTYITKFSIVLIHYENGKFNISDSASNRGTNNELQSTSPWSVLIPSDEHDIELIDKNKAALPEETKINTMKIGSDFVISSDEEDELMFPFYDHEKDTYYAIELDI